MKQEQSSVIWKVINLKKFESQATKLSLSVLALAVINKKPSHGYQIIKELSILPKKPAFSEVYPLLHKLEKLGLVKSKKEGRRKVYSITREGKKGLSEAVKLMKKAEVTRKQVFNKFFKGIK